MTITPFCVTAVQHERGPRKPKNKLKTASGLHRHEEKESMRSLSTSSTPTPVIPVCMPALPTPIEAPIDLRVPTKTAEASLTSFPVRGGEPHQAGFLHSLLSAEQMYEAPGVPMRTIFGDVGLCDTSAFKMAAPHLLGESLQEVTARLLFSIVNWIKHIPAFLSLPNRDQVSF